MTQEEFEIKRKTMCDKITGCAFASYNYWRDCVDELVYEAGLCCELEDAGFIVHRQEDFPISERWGFDPNTQKCYRIR